MLSALLSVYNAEKFLAECIEDALPHLDELIIIEGSWNAERSTDKTIEIIRGWQDNSKVILHENSTIKGPECGRNLYFDLTEAREDDWMLILDADEFYSVDDWKEMKRISYADRADGYKFNQRVFVNDFNTYVEMQMPRMARIESDCKIVTANYDGNHMMDRYGAVYKYEVHPSIKIFHYAYILSPERFSEKAKQRESEGRPLPWHLSEGKIKRDDKKFFEFKGEHPKIITERYIK